MSRDRYQVPDWLVRARAERTRQMGSQREVHSIEMNRDGNYRYVYERDPLFDRLPRVLAMNQLKKLPKTSKAEMERIAARKASREANESPVRGRVSGAKDSVRPIDRRRSIEKEPTKETDQ